LHCPDLFDVLQLLQQPALASAQTAAVKFQFCFAWPSGPDPSAQPGKRYPLSCQPRKKIIDLRQLHLQFSFRGARSLRKNIKDQLRSVKHLSFQELLNIAHLSGCERIIKQNHVDIACIAVCLDLFQLPLTAIISRVAFCPFLKKRLEDIGPGRDGQGRQFF